MTAVLPLVGQLPRTREALLTRLSLTVPVLWLQAYGTILTPVLLLQQALLLAAKDIVVAGMTWKSHPQER